MDSVEKLAYLAAQEAIEDSGLFTKEFYPSERVGLSVGTLGEVALMEQGLRENAGNLRQSFDQNLINAFSLNLMIGALADRFGIFGSVSTHLNGCSSGTHAGAYGYDLIQDGIVDAMIVGGSDTLAQIVFTNFHNLKNLAPEHCQPFDRNRKGLMLGGGAGFLILEREDLARKRGARIYCEMNGYGWSCDGYHLTSPHPEGEGGARAMQNAQNLMSSFEFIAALMSIIIGLGVTNLLAGAGRAFYRRNENPLDEVHIVLTLATLLLLALQWWVTFKWNTEVNWSFDKFLVLIVWTITLYMLTVFLYPPDLSEAEEHQGRFERNRAGYYSTFIAMCLLDVTQTAIHGDIFHPIWYLPFIGQYAVLAGAGLIAHKRSYDRFFAWYQLITLLVWALMVRRFLVGDATTP